MLYLVSIVDDYRSMVLLALKLLITTCNNTKKQETEDES